MARAGYGERLPAWGVGYQGTAAEDGDEYRGRLLGHFVDPDARGNRHTTDLEVKWGIHPLDRPARAGPPAKPAPHSS